MTSHLLQARLNQRQTLMDSIESILERASTEERDLNATELQVVGEHRRAVEEMAPTLAEYEAVEAARVEGDRLRGLMRTSTSAPARTDRYSYESGAQFVLDRAAVLDGNRVGAPAEYVRAAQDRLERADQITTSNPGLLPQPITGAVVSFIDSRRPIVVSSARQPMPQYGNVFTRPVVTQHTLAGGPKVEKVDGVSQVMTVTRLTVTKATYGGWVDISREDIDWTSPSILDAVYQDLQEVTGLQTEGVAAALLATVTADAGQKIVLAAGATAAVTTTAIYQAAALVYAGAKQMADTIYASIDQWSRLGGLTDTTGRALFPSLAPFNAPGQMSAVSWASNPFGLNLVVSPALPVGTLIVGVSKHLETYDSSQGFQQTVEPRKNGLEVAFWATYANVLLNGTKSFSFLAP